MHRLRRGKTNIEILPGYIQDFVKGKGLQETIKDKIQFFKENEIQNYLYEDDFAYILNALTYKFLPEETEVVRFGEIGDKFYIILSGSVNVYIPDNTKDIKMEEVIREESEEHFDDESNSSDSYRLESVDLVNQM